MKKFIIVALFCVAALVVIHNALPVDIPDSTNISYKDGMDTIPNRMLVATAFQFVSEWDLNNLIVAKIATASYGDKKVWFVALPWMGWTYGGQIDPQAGTISFAGL